MKGHGKMEHVVCVIGPPCHVHVLHPEPDVPGRMLCGAKTDVGLSFDQSPARLEAAVLGSRLWVCPKCLRSRRLDKEDADLLLRLPCLPTHPEGVHA